MSTSPDLMDAVAQYLVGSPPLAAAFGNDASALATRKFWADQSMPGVKFPRTSYQEFKEERTPMSVDKNGIVNYICKGHFAFIVEATTKLQARQLCDQIAQLLEDAPLVFSDGELLEITPEGFEWTEVTEPQNDGAIVAYARAVTFVYVVQRTF